MERVLDFAILSWGLDVVDVPLEKNNNKYKTLTF